MLTLLQVDMEWRGDLHKTTILYMGPSMSFHVDLGEGTEKDSRTELKNDHLGG